MYIRPCYRRKNGKRHAYWALVESFRTENGPRQRVVGYLGSLPGKTRRGIRHAAEGNRDTEQGSLFPDADDAAEWVEIDAGKVRVENPLAFGGPWLAMQLVRMLGLDAFLADAMPRGREKFGWDLTSLILILCRLLNPSSELEIAEHFYRSTAMPEILGVPASGVEDTRLYRVDERAGGSRGQKFTGGSSGRSVYPLPLGRSRQEGRSHARTLFQAHGKRS